MSRMPCSITDGPASEEDANEPEYQHPEQDPTDAERAQNVAKRTNIEKLNDELREVANGLDRSFRLLREMAE